MRAHTNLLIILGLLLLIGVSQAATTLFLLPVNASDPAPNAKQSADTIHRDVAGTYAKYTFPGVMSTVPGTSYVASESTQAEAGAVHYTHYGTWISNPLNWQWVNGTVTVNVSMREGNTGANAMPRLKIYKWFANDTKGQELRTIGNSATEIAATTAYPAKPVLYFNAVTLTSTFFERGDRIVIELESYDNNAVTTSWVHGIRYGGAANSSTGSYVRFSADLKFAPPKPVAVYSGSTAIRDWIDSHSPEETSAFLSTATATAFQAKTLPYDINYGNTVLTIEKFRYDPVFDTCGFWIHATRNGQSVATNSPVWVFPPPFQVVDSDVIDPIKNERVITIREDSALAFEQIFAGYVDRQDIGTAVVGTPE